MYFGNSCIRGELGFLKCDDICMFVVNKQLELLEFGFNSIYVDLKDNEIYLTFTAGSVCLCGVCSSRPLRVCEVVHGTLCGRCSDCDACSVVCVACEYGERV